LEADLGVRLLNRTTRSVTPTEAGERLLARLTPALADVTLALDEVNAFRDSPIGVLKLNVPGAVSRIVFPDLIPRFLKAHPGMRVEVSVEDAFVDVLAAGFDAGARYDERLEKDMIAVPLAGPQRFVVVGSPAYFAERGRPAHPRDVLNHPCIRHRFASGTSYAWEFEKDGEVIRVQPEGPLITSSGDLELAAAEAGIGLLATFEGFVRGPDRGGQAGDRARRLAAAVQRTLSLLSQPAAHARAAAGVRGFREGGARGDGDAGCGSRIALPRL
jgi:DNA-binding transcriptional LysR family regulator